MTEPLERRAPVMRLGALDQSCTHRLHHHSAVLSGTMTQTLGTEPHQTYRLTYESRSHPLEPNARRGSGVGDVLIDAVVVQTFVTPSGARADTHETYFTARSSEASLSFSVVGRVPFALQNVSVTKVAMAPFCERDMLEAMLGS